MKDKRRIMAIVLSIFFVFSAILDLISVNKNIVEAAATLNIPAFVTASSLKVRTKAGLTKPQLMINGQNVYLTKNQEVKILKEKTKKDGKWYYISFLFNKKIKKGYVSSDYIKIKLGEGVKIKILLNEKVKIYTGAGSKKSYLKIKGKVVTLKKNKTAIIMKEVIAENQKWFRIKFFDDRKKLYKGYLPANLVRFKSISITPNNTPQPTKTPKPTSNTEEEKTIGTVMVNTLNVRTGAGINNDLLVYQSAAVKLEKGQMVTILEEKSVDKTIWYKISFTYKDTTLIGYVSGDYLKTETIIVTKPEPTITPTKEPEITPKPTITPSPEPTIEPTPTITPTPTPIPPTPTPIALSDAEFEAALTAEGFPEDYKQYLRELHKIHPYWQFKAFQTGLDWNTVVTQESKVGKNLIPNSKNVAWKSTETGAYNWGTDRFIAYDGTTWVTASKEANAYYIDPRNFLTEKGIFQFELLTYQESYQTKSGVENILASTPMYNSSYTYIDSQTKQTKTISYSDTFIEAARYSKVSPFHLATRAKQEIVISSSSFSASATGNYSGYIGYYNFYNIGASDSAGGGAVAKGLNFAKNGTNSSSTNTLFLIPWDSRYKAIIGGAKYIGNNYINRGQDTLYLQKFNATSSSTYDHQYMSNIEAAASEATKTYNAYSKMSELPLIFSIPVYLNMPEKVSAQPVDALNPNNWLKSLSIDKYSLTPTFNVNNSEDTIYTLIVDNEVDSITINASPVSDKATVAGTGKVSISVGVNPINITVIAENGIARTYKIEVIRN